MCGFCELLMGSIIPALFLIDIDNQKLAFFFLFPLPPVLEVKENYCLAFPPFKCRLLNLRHFAKLPLF